MNPMQSRPALGGEAPDRVQPAPAGEERKPAGAAPGHASPDGTGAANLSEVLWALSLAFGVAGGLCAAFGYPLMLYVIPLSFGGAGLVLAFVARIAPGRARPGWAILAVIGAVIALASGIDSRDEFKDSTESFNLAIESLRE